MNLKCVDKLNFWIWSNLNQLLVSFIIYTFQQEILKCYLRSKEKTLFVYYLSAFVSVCGCSFDNNISYWLSITSRQNFQPEWNVRSSPTKIIKKSTGGTGGSLQTAYTFEQSRKLLVMCWPWTGKITIIKKYFSRTKLCLFICIKYLLFALFYYYPF